MRAGPSQEEIRRQNLGALLRFVHVRGSISRAELTSELGLNRSTIGALTADLAAVGLVSEEAPRETGRAGRPSLVVRPSSDLVYAYAASVEVDRIRVARVGLGGVILDQREAPRPRGEAIEAVRPVADFVAQMAEQVKPQARCIGAGIAVCGLVRREDGLVRLGPHLGWLDEPLGHALQDRLPDLLPQVAVGNVADLCALAEHTRGVAVGCDNIIYMYGDVGVGAGIIAGGRRVTGHGGYGGEVGHMVVNPHGRACGCGSRGCWETEIGEHALLHAAGRDTAQGAEAVLAVVEAAARGDATAQVAVRQVGDWLGFGVANLVNIFNPELVIFGGTLRDVYLAAAAQVRSRLNSIGLPATREHVRLRTPKLGGDAALLGAAELAFEQLLADPLG
ncbi:ROK family transcriptional regulator [Catellatospora sp. NPDC049111]|jgi:predicted NBD/HSP70 family sugar kinase|uniref:Sugar kinase n=2 Tax=Catellatospora TaxID=53365 RepID=A0A8J3KT49_9ACTN|nr:ROK family transcriptional regulator [Catellatospora coxensis]GIG05752.1 sugar kinase [Catellatospora coxensis]